MNAGASIPSFRHLFSHELLGFDISKEKGWRKSRKNNSKALPKDEKRHQAALNKVHVFCQENFQKVRENKTQHEKTQDVYLTDKATLSIFYG